MRLIAGVLTESKDGSLYSTAVPSVSCTTPTRAPLGFAALAVSQIRPIREMGVWTASGLAIAWLTAFTLFPALQRLLSCPTRRGTTSTGRLSLRFADALPGFTYRFRWPILVIAFAVMVAGGAALFGVPGGLPTRKPASPHLSVH
jgi:predicted RND superfamily exporter protein